MGAGTLTVGANSRRWAVPSMRAPWIPTGVPREVVSPRHTTMMSLYLPTAPHRPAGRVA
ncbi:hypothetical protein [Streptomyces sp. CA2R101]|uniref:hypothetical protein n=1 Tax=Streptomyces sp. CA2R101 TaxID=3120152 RepID=UPI00300B395A